MVRSVCVASSSSCVTMTKVCPNLSRSSKNNRCNSPLFCVSRLPEARPPRLPKDDSLRHGLQPHAAFRHPKVLPAYAWPAPTIPGNPINPMLPFGQFPPTCLNQRRHHDILYRRKLRQQLVKLKNKTDFPVPEGRKFFFFQTVHLRTVQYNSSSVRLVECTHNLQQGSLSRPTGTYNTDHFTFPDFKVNPLQHLKCTKLLVIPFN